MTGTRVTTSSGPLWLAPEVEEDLGERVRRDTEDRVMSTLQNTRAELP